MVMALHNALLSMTPKTGRATIHVNYTVLFIISVYCVLFGMIDYLISIMFAAGLFTLICCASLEERMSETISLHNN